MDKVMLHPAVQYSVKQCLVLCRTLNTYCTFSQTSPTAKLTTCLKRQNSNKPTWCLPSVRTTSSLCLLRGSSCDINGRDIWGCRSSLLFHQTPRKQKLCSNMSCQHHRRLSVFGKVSRAHSLSSAWTLADSQSGDLIISSQMSDVLIRHAGLEPPLLTCQMRHKSKKRSVDSESDSDSDEDDNLNDDDFEAPGKFKVMKIHSASLRTDAIISTALNIARNRLEEAFFGPGLLLNGEKMLKKSEKMDEGDYVDLVMERVEGEYKVKRVKVLRVYPGKTTTGKTLVKVRVWKSPFLVAVSDNRHGS